MSKTRHSKKNSRRNQKLYRMKGCSKTYKNHLGGSSSNFNLAYPSNNVPTVPNPFLAYSPTNVNGANPVYPSTGPVSTGFNFLNPQGSQNGGGCGCGIPQMGGSCPTCVTKFMTGGNHRKGCKCSTCKMSKRGGSGNNGIPYPDGLVGKPWTPSTGGWPGVRNVGGDSNYLAPNTYDTDVQTATINTGANPPFSIGGKRKTRRRKGQRGGTYSNFLTQDLINLGRQFQFGLGSAYNAVSGYSAPTNPMPWKGQFTNQPNLAAIKANLII